MNDNQGGGENTTENLPLVETSAAVVDYWIILLNFE